MEDLTPGTPQSRKVFTLAYLANDLLAQFNIQLKDLPKVVVCKFSEDMLNRPWPFTVKIIPTATITEYEEWNKLANEDWKDEITRSLKYPVSSGDLIDIPRLNSTNMKIHAAHEEIDTYPFYQVVKSIEKGDL